MDNTVAEHRAFCGWSQEELATRVRVTRQTIISIEKGRFDPSLPLAFRLAKVFGITIEELFEPWDDEDEDESLN
ncbi:MAG: helix-turn-helix transcriptional regulator [Propionibacteriaceae bacterium]|jgi:putative transcriptional regulator|nr:helix-turn-helix transcriptional regulator [Propionibacteriaceae bacterium]